MPAHGFVDSGADIIIGEDLTSSSSRKAEDLKKADREPRTYDQWTLVRVYNFSAHGPEIKMAGIPDMTTSLCSKQKPHMCKLPRGFAMSAQRKPERAG